MEVHIGLTPFLETALRPWEDSPGRALGSQDGKDKGAGQGRTAALRACI